MLEYIAAAKRIRSSMRTASEKLGFQLRRAARRPWNPSFSLAVRILLLMRFAAAMYSNIDDCDEGAPAAPYSSVLMRNSLQLLGAAPFFRPRTRVSDMGSLSPIRHSELDVH